MDRGPRQLPAVPACRLRDHQRPPAPVLQQAPHHRRAPRARLRALLALVLAAAGHYRDYAASFSLWRVRDHRGQPYYSRMTIRFWKNGRNVTANQKRENDSTERPRIGQLQLSACGLTIVRPTLRICPSRPSTRRRPPITTCSPRPRPAWPAVESVTVGPPAGHRPVHAAPGTAPVQERPGTGRAEASRAESCHFSGCGAFHSVIRATETRRGTGDRARRAGRRGPLPE